MIYYAVVILLLLFSVLHQVITDKNQLKPFFYFSVLIILLLGGLRYEVGTDWSSYYDRFYALESVSDVFSSREEKLFMLLMYLFTLIVDNFSFFSFWFFLGAFLIKVKIINNYSTDGFISLMVYFSTIFLLYDINGIRQGMAISITLLSIPAILSRNLSRFITTIIIAALFHTSALIFIPFYWLANINFSKKKILLIVGGTLLLSIPLRFFVLNNPLMQYLLTIERLSQYDAFLKDSEVNTSVSIFSIAVLQRILVFLFIIINFNKLKASEPVRRMLLNGYAISILIFLLFSFSAEFAARLGFYYKSLETLIIPLIVSSQIRISNRILLLGVFFVLSFLSIFRMLAIEGGNLLPFDFYPFLS